MVHVCTSEVGKAKAEALEASCRVPDRMVKSSISSKTSPGTLAAGRRGPHRWGGTQVPRAAAKEQEGRVVFTWQIFPDASRRERPEGPISTKPQWNEDEGAGAPGFELAHWLNRCAWRGDKQQDKVVTGHSSYRRVRLGCGWRERGSELHAKRRSQTS